MVRWKSVPRIHATTLLADDGGKARELFMISPHAVIITGLLDVWPEPLQAMCSWKFWLNNHDVATCHEYEGYDTSNTCAPFSKVRFRRCTKTTVSGVTKRILQGDAVRIMHETSGQNESRGDLLVRETPGVGASHARLPRRSGNRSFNMYITGVGATTRIHYDRERNSNLHFCLVGGKRILYFDADQSEAILKHADVSSSVIDFSRVGDPIYCSQFPSLRIAVGSDIYLQPGEMLYMPQCSWHYMEYTEPNVSATVAFYASRCAKLYGIHGRESLLFQLRFNESAGFSNLTMSHHIFMSPVYMICAPYAKYLPYARAHLHIYKWRLLLSVLNFFNDTVVMNAAWLLGWVWADFTWLICGIIVSCVKITGAKAKPWICERWVWSEVSWWRKILYIRREDFEKL